MVKLSGLGFCQSIANALGASVDWLLNGSPDANEATFKKLVIDGGQKYLKGLNPAWPMIPINGNCKIIGVVIETRVKFI